MARKQDILSQRQEYARIKALEKEKLGRIPPTEMTPEREHLRLTFARECWKKKGTLAPSGMTWEQVFKNHWGIDLFQFAEDEKRRQRERSETHNIVVDPDLP